jgi:mannose-6-phosphate isomerase
MPEPELYPLTFRPIFRRYLWGGRRLHTELQKAIGPEADYAESWEVVDRGGDQSVVATGPLAGVSLGELVRSQGKRLLGQHHPQARFPLLFKFLDAQQMLSVQVHPNDQQAATLTPPDLGKTEAWVILAAEPGSFLYAGLQPGCDRAVLSRELAGGTCEVCLHRIEPSTGDCFFLPAGTVHALGPGLLVAEIQQSSDTTYRLFDWNRVGTDGKPRALHIDQSMEVIDFSRGPIMARMPAPLEPTHDLNRGERLVSCPQFVLDRWQISKLQSFGGDDRCHLLVVLAGTCKLDHSLATEPLSRGKVALLPAVCGPVGIYPKAGETCLLLDIYLPESTR